MSRARAREAPRTDHEKRLDFSVERIFDDIAISMVLR